MERRLLLVISDRFQLSDGRLVLAPDFPLKQEICKESLPTRGEIVTPAGDFKECVINVFLTHFNLPESTDINERWRYVVELSGISKEDLPTGSSLYVFHDIWRQDQLLA